MKAIDSVHDLPRVLRVPGTYNYKLGKENAPLCHMVEVNDIRFTPESLDAQLNEPSSTKEPKQARRDIELIYQSANSREFDTWRAIKMLEVIPVAALSRDEWLNIGMALKNNGNNVSDWEQWSRPDARFKTGECEKLWQGFTGTGLTIATICDIAERYGYNAKSVYNEWCSLHPEFKIKVIHKSIPTSDDEEEKSVWTQEMIKSCPVNLRLPNNYLFNHKGITLVVPPKKDGDNPKYVCAARTPIVVTKIFREPKQNTFTYEIATLIRGVWRTTEIAGKALADPRSIITLADNGALIDEPKLTCRFLNAVISLNPNLQEIKAYDQPGWHDGKFIYPTGGKDYVVRRAGFNYAEEFATRGDSNILKNAFLEACQKGGAVARLYLGAGLASILIQPLNILNAQIQLNSKSGGGKTALAKLAAALFGNPRELIWTFGATEKNRQSVAAISDISVNLGQNSLLKT